MAPVTRSSLVPPSSFTFLPVDLRTEPCALPPAEFKLRLGKPTTPRVLASQWLALAFPVLDGFAPADGSSMPFGVEDAPITLPPRDVPGDVPWIPLPGTGRDPPAGSPAGAWLLSTEFDGGAPTAWTAAFKGISWPVFKMALSNTTPSEDSGCPAPRAEACVTWPMILVPLGNTVLPSLVLRSVTVRAFIASPGFTFFESSEPVSSEFMSVPVTNVVSSVGDVSVVFCVLAPCPCLPASADCSPSCAPACESGCDCAAEPVAQKAVKLSAAIIFAVDPNLYIASLHVSPMTI